MSVTHPYCGLAVVVHFDAALQGRVVGAVGSRVQRVEVRWITGFLDSPDRTAESFWLAVCGGSMSARRGPGGEFATIVPAAGDAFLRVQETGAGATRSHLDLYVSDVPAAAGSAVALGARVTHAEGGLVVLRSPAGLAFCLVSWEGESVVPAAVRWPGGHASAVDQMSLDLPAEAFDAEAGFWVALTGWELRAANRPEFAFLVRPDAMPLRLLLQRLESGPAGMHLDLACDDVDAEVARHVASGARVERRVPGDWTTLRDPAGRRYCVTSRSPWRVSVGAS